MYNVSQDANMFLVSVLGNEGSQEVLKEAESLGSVAICGLRIRSGEMSGWNEDYGNGRLNVIKFFTLLV